MAVETSFKGISNDLLRSVVENPDTFRLGSPAYKLIEMFDGEVQEN